ncbi:aldo/keto reductase [Weissella sagaensis]|uniref:aldo/keto reductase n=1 Tax=Weissella sagaensis TaxID=2559928 RepID=UPI00123AC001|nr:aldo/keto reductase [Weissella sagaensis]KAA8433938.1 aldo/keto reductase [Weissella paramesenteroides]KAA8438292.1 aldo/keto reductase [Weissella paramesenteroides]MBU7568152.1 aldo/keto reductase [Weissella hellenica]
MSQINLGGSGLMVPQIALGVMRMGDKTEAQAQEVVETALSKGVNFFDTADIYGNGASTKSLAKALKAVGAAREDIILQSKGGILSDAGPVADDGILGPRYEFSKEHIIASVDAELARLDTDYLDVFLLHRPDVLMQPEEIAAAFNELAQQGKVKQFGVSNMNPWQVELIQSVVDQKLVANQLQFGVMHTGMVDAGLHVNMADSRSVDHDGGILPYSQLKNMTIQAWSPFQYGMFEGHFIDNDKFPELNMKLQEIADKHHSTKNGIAVAFILTHPASMQVILGSMTPSRLVEMIDGQNVQLSHQEWYDIYFAAGNDLP